MPQSPFNHETSPLLGDLEMGHIGMAKTINNSYSLPRGGVASLKELIPILDYCSVQIVNVPETFRIVFKRPILEKGYFDFKLILKTYISSLFKKGIEHVTASINLQKVQVFIKESHKKMKNQFILQRINQPALGLDQISLDATINIPQSDEDEVNKVPSVEVNVDINELSQRLDVTLMRLIVRVSNQKS